MHGGRLYLARLIQLSVHELVRETPSAYRGREHRAVAVLPACVAKVHTRPTRNLPSKIREAGRAAAA